MVRGIKYEKLEQGKLALEEKVEDLENENASLRALLQVREATILRLQGELGLCSAGSSSKRTQMEESSEDEVRKKARTE
jgi:hypothetical protein